MPRKRDGLTRRQFLSETTTMAAALAAATALSEGLAHAQAPKAPEPKLGAQLIGKLEGPELVLDAARWPKKLSEIGRAHV